MPDIFALDNEDIKRLGSQGLVDLVHLLANNEARANGIPLSSIDTSLAITVPDGGIDSRASWADGASHTDFYPARYTGIQIKAGELAPGRMATDVINLDANPPHLKPQVQRIIDANGAYVMIYGQDAPGENHDLRVEGIREQIRAHSPTGAVPLVELYDASKMAAWASRFAHTFVFVASRTRAGLPRGTMLYSEWSSLRDHKHKFIKDEEVETQLSTIITALEQDGSATHIDGIPGLGKSRLAIEACREYALRGLEAIYVDAGGRSSAEISDAVLGWRRMSASGLVVVDNCPPDLHKNLEQLVSGTALRLLTIDYALEDIPPSSAQLRLKRRSDFVVRGILSEAYGTALQGPELERLVDFAYGSPRMARMIADAEIVLGGTEGRLLPDTELIDRIIFGRRAVDETVRRVLVALSLFEHVGRSGNVAGQFEYLRTAVVPDIPADQFERIANELEQREIVARVGDYVRVSPPPMAVRLALRWLDTEPEARRTALITDISMPMGLVEMFCRQFRYLETIPRAAELATRLCEAQGPFGVAEVLKTRRGARIFRALAPLDREVATTTLLREFGARSEDYLRKVTDARRDLLYALQLLAFNTDQFVRAAFVIAAFANAENESYSNNATGILTSFFRPYLGGTAAGPELRWQLVRLIAKRGWDSLAVDCLSLAIGEDSGWRSVGPEYQRGEVLEDWSPGTIDDLRQYVSESLRLLMAYSSAPEMRSSIRAAVAKSARFILRLGLNEELAEAIHELSAGDDIWREMLEALQSARKYDIGDDAKKGSFVDGLIQAIQPHSFEDRLRLLVGSPVADFDPKDMIDLNEARRGALIDEIIARGSLLNIVPLVSEGEQVAGYDFGFQVGKKVGDLDPVIDAAMSALRDVGERANASFLGGLLRATRDRDAALFDQTADMLVNDSDLKRFAPWLVAVTQPVDLDIDRLLPVAADPNIAEASFMSLAYGRSLQNVSTRTVRLLISVLLDRKAFIAAVMIAHMQGKVHAPEDYAIELSRAFSEWSFVSTELNSFLDHSFREEFASALRRDGGDVIARKSTADAVSIAINKDAGYDAHTRSAEVLALLFEIRQDDAWDVFLTALLAVDETKRYWLLSSLEYIPSGATHHASALLKVSHTRLLEWASRDPGFAPAYLAGKVPLYSEDGNSVVPNALLIKLLTNFGDRANVRDSLLGNLLSFASIGSRVPHLEKRLAVLRKLPDFDGVEALNWKAETERYFVEEIEAQRRRDEEFKHGIF